MGLQTVQAHEEQSDLQCLFRALDLPYFLGYKTEFFFSFHNYPKNLDLSYKMDLDLWDCLRKEKFDL